MQAPTAPDFDILVTVDGDEPFRTSFAAFLADNEDADDDLPAFRPALLAGLPVHMGGGAGVAVTIRAA